MLDELKKGFKVAEFHFAKGAKIGHQENAWHLWRADGESIESGKSIENLIYKLYKNKKPK